MKKAFARPRPIRVVFLVEENEYARQQIQAVYANCYGRWAGRFNLLIPCENGSVRPSFLPWLHFYDPDIIYSYVDLNDDFVTHLHEFLYPSYLIKHNNYIRAGNNNHDFRPKLPLTALSSLSCAWIASRGSVIHKQRPVKIVDYFGRSAPTQLLQENFGFYRESSNPWPIPINVSEYVEDFSYIDRELADLGNFSPRPRGEFKDDPYDFLNCLAEDRDISGMALISAWMSPRLQMNDPRWSNRVNIIIGDSFVDQLTFWNARSYLSAHLDSSLVTLKLAASDLTDQRVFPALIKLVKKRINVSHSGNNSRITLLSSSHSAEELNAFVQRFQQADTWNIYSAEALASIDELCPSPGVLEGSFSLVEDGVFRSGDWHEIDFSEEGFKPPVINPRHIRDAPSTLAPLTRGAWALDFNIERTLDYSRFANVRHSWRLPRRLRLTQAFTPGYSLADQSNNICVPRVEKDGLISLVCSIDGKLPDLTVPDDETAFRYALCAQRDWLPFAAGRGPLRSSLFYDIRASDKGRYLTALIRLTGDIHCCREIFLNRFWKKQFEMLGASTQVGQDMLPELVRRLRKRLSSGKIESDEEWQRIAMLVQSEARSLRLNSRFLRFDFLREAFDEFRNAYWEKNEAGAPRSEWDDWERGSLTHSVQFLCKREILHQGHEWLCPKCNNTNWIGIDTLKKLLTCGVCGHSEPAPVSEPWHFKLNAFVTEGLRSHGLLAEIWCLSRLSDRAQTSFYFLEPHELIFRPPNMDVSAPDAEIDLIVVVDGIVHLCEAKTSNHVNLDKLSKLALMIRPDVVTLAIMEPASSATARRLEKLRELLKGSNIRAEVLALEHNDIEEGPNLPR